MNEYYAIYIILIEGATWGRKEHAFEAESDEEALELALDYESNYRDGKAELLIDYLYDPDGNEIEIER